MNKIKTIIQKEWAEVFKNRMVLFTVAFLPLIMVAIPLGIIYSTRGANMGNAADMPAQMNALCPTNLNGAECFQVFMVSQFMLLFMIIPLTIPVTISAYSIVGEKTTRSLEPLLATPISVTELMIGKGLASLIPAVVATYGAFLIYAAGAFLMVQNKAIVAAMLDARWLIAIGLVGPLMALMAIMVSIIVSSRVNDPRVAEQLSMVVIVPVLAIFFGQMSGLFIVNRQLILLIAVALVAVNFMVGYLAVRLFQREVILTRWK
jgi:ABC-2 type transport system permease protein